MYLQRVPSEGGYHYMVRESFRDNGVWRYRDMVNIGPDPRRHIEYHGAYDFSFDEELLHLLRGSGIDTNSSEILDMFLPFMAPHIRQLLEFAGAEGPYRKSRLCQKNDLLRYQSELHSFDARRMHFLRFGRVDIGELDGRPWNFLNVLSCKCRDEVEATFSQMEQALRPREYASYVYTSLHLQKYFKDSMLRDRPFGLDLDQVDAGFLSEICRLNADDHYFRGLNRERTGSTLHPFLVKYMIMYIDYPFVPDTTMRDILEEMMRRRRFRAQPSPRTTMVLEEAFGVLGIDAESFLRMGRKQLTRAYRVKALKLHPDKGGDQDSFVRLKEAFDVLLSRKAA